MRKRTRDRGLLQLGKGMQPDKRVSYDELNAGTGPQPVVASVRDVCVRCLAAVWLSRTTEEAMTHMRQPEIRCVHCVATELEQEHGRPSEV